jgi:hypothetical protein
MATKERDRLFTIRISDRELATLSKAAKAAKVSVSDYVRERVGISSMAVSSEVTAVTDAIASGKEKNPYQALDRLAHRLEWFVRVWLEVIKLRAKFQDAATRTATDEKVSTLAERISAELEWEKVEA